MKIKFLFLLLFISVSALAQTNYDQIGRYVVRVDGQELSQHNESDTAQTAAINAAINNPDSVVLVEGPTWSAKADIVQPVPDTTPDTTPIPDQTPPPVGFTEIKPSADSLVLYVSSSQGSDANDCSQPDPCKTIAEALNKLRDGFPDHLLLKRGDSFTSADFGEVRRNLPSGRSAQEPIVISSYGQGSRPTIRGGFVIDGNESDKRGFINFIGLRFYSYRHDPDNSGFDGGSFHPKITLNGAYHDILFEDNKFDFMELVIQGWVAGNPKNITIRRNIFTGAYINTSSDNHTKRPSNLYISAIDGLLVEENVLDFGGWNPRVQGAGANSRNHNVYIVDNNVSKNIVFRNNIVVRGSSHGLLARPGGTYENNFLARNAVQLSIGYSNRQLGSGEFANVFDNVISETDTMEKGSPIANSASGAVWGIEISKNIGNPDYIKLERNIISKELTNGGIRRGYQRNGANTDEKDNVQYDVSIWNSFNNPHDGAYPDPDRTLATYNKALGGSESFDDFMTVVKNRPPNTWDARYTAGAINDYIREGFGL